MRLNLSTEALARFSARRPWTVIAVWALVLFAALALVATTLSGALTDEAEFTSNPDSKRGERLLEERLRGPEQFNETVIVRSGDLTVDSPAFQGFVEELHGRIAALGGDVVAGSTSYYQAGDPSLVSADRRTTIIPVVLAGTESEVLDDVERVRDVVHAAGGEDGFQLLVTGQASTFADIREAADRDLRKAEILDIPAALAILVLVFGALVAAVVPLVLAAVAIAVALGLSAIVGQVFQLTYFVTNMITMIGLAVGIDYSLFVLSRYREERRRGRPKLAAIEAAGATASRTVFFSGMTVVLALVGMLIIPTSVFQSLGTGAILVVLVAVAASLTLLPAILGLAGDRLYALRVPFLGRGATGGSPGGFWDRVTRLVTRRAPLALIAACALLIAAAVPYYRLNTGQAGVSTLPEGLEAREGFEILAQQFSGGLSAPVEIVIDGRIASPPVQQGIQQLSDTLEADAAFGPIRPLEVNQAGDLALLSLPVTGDPDGSEAVQAVKTLRRDYIPQAFQDVDAEVVVTGGTAFTIDFSDLTSDYTPIVFAFVLGLSFVLLTVVFRSLVVPLKAILMNLLSVGAAYGLLVLVFQEGVGAGLLGFQQIDTVEAWIPLFLFSVLFGLSMDYHVFLLSRMRERYDQTGDNDEAVAFGLRSTGGIITGAALIMVAVFSGFAAGDLVMFQQLGFGLAVAVFLDATIVRSVLVPAAMKLLGGRNWYLPAALEWLPKVRVEEGDGAVGPAKAS